MFLINIVRSLEGHPDDDRKEIVCQHLDYLGIDYERHCYRGGENIIVSSGRDVEVGVGSHFDVVPGSPGANDNGSTIAVTLDVLRRVQEKPLKHIGVRGFFFDEEELGLKGSRVYIGKYGILGLLGLYNMELVGSGDRAALWSVDLDQDTELLTTLESQAKSCGVQAIRFPHIIANAADHMSFNRAGLRDAFTITTISASDLEIVPEYMAAIAGGADMGKLWDIMSRAPVFEHYHKPTDLSEHLDEQTLQMVSDLLYDSVCEIDGRRN